MGAAAEATRDRATRSFAEAREVVGGYWMIDVKSPEEAVEWAKRCPMRNDEIIEVRQVQEMSDFPDDVQEAAKGLPDMQRRANEGSGG